MQIKKRTVTTAFHESVENYRFEGSFVEENDEVVSFNANVDLITDAENDIRENLGYINLRQVNGKDIKTICHEFIDGVKNLLNTLLEHEN